MCGLLGVGKLTKSSAAVTLKSVGRVILFWFEYERKRKSGRIMQGFCVGKKGEDGLCELTELKGKSASEERFFLRVKG